MTKRRVVITGIGAISPVGHSATEMWESIKNGVCGIAPITHYDTTDRKVKLAGEVKDYKPEEFLDKKEARKMDKFCQFAMIAATEAFEDSQLDMTKEDASRCGVIVASGIGGIGTYEVEHTKGMSKGYDRISPFFIPMVIPNMAAAQIAIKYGLHGMSTCIVTACASSNNAIGDSFRQIRDNYADVMVCGGAEATITETTMGGFTSMKALTTEADPARASIPFDKERSGFVMGEGAGILVLEEYEHAKKRGAKIYGEVVGYAANCDGYHITSPAPDGKYAGDCMSMAIADAGITPEQIGYINAHGTSTPLNERYETIAIKNAFGDYASKVMVSSTKSMTGHLLGASGAIEGIISTMALKDGYIPATIHYQVPDEECDLDVVPNEGRNIQVEYALSNSLGFGGHNASLVFKRYVEE